MGSDVEIALLSTMAVLVVGWLGFRASERDSRRDQIQDAGQSVAALTTTVLAMGQRVESLEGRVRKLEDENADLRRRLVDAFAYIGELIRWAQAGRAGAFPMPHASIAADVVLPASWLHPTTEED